MKLRKIVVNGSCDVLSGELPRSRKAKAQQSIVVLTFSWVVSICKITIKSLIHSKCPLKDEKQCKNG